MTDRKQRLKRAAVADFIYHDHVRHDIREPFGERLLLFRRVDARRAAFIGIIVFLAACAHLALALQFKKERYFDF